MQSAISMFIQERIEEIVGKLHRTHAEYALANAACRHLLDTIEPIILSQTDLQISAGDCFALRSYFDNELTQNAILEEALYRQGYLDCIRLLSELGALI